MFFPFPWAKKFRHIILFDDGYGTTSLLTLLHFNLSRNQCGALIPYFGCDWISLLIFWHGLISLSRNFKMKGNFFVAWLGVSILTDLYPSMQLCVIINSSIFLMFYRCLFGRDLNFLSFFILFAFLCIFSFLVMILSHILLLLITVVFLRVIIALCFQNMF